MSAFISRRVEWSLFQFVPGFPINGICSFSFLPSLFSWFFLSSGSFFLFFLSYVSYNLLHSFSLFFHLLMKELVSFSSSCLLLPLVFLILLLRRKILEIILSFSSVFYPSYFPFLSFFLHSLSHFFFLFFSSISLDFSSTQSVREREREERKNFPSR